MITTLRNDAKMGPSLNDDSSETMTHHQQAFTIAGVQCIIYALMLCY